MPFNVGKTDQNPAGEPLYAAARRLRLDLEAQLVAERMQDADDPATIQAIGLLLQVEGIDRQARLQAPITVIDGGPRTATLRRSLELVTAGRADGTERS